MILDRATLLEAELRDSLRSGRLFGEYDEPLDDYGKRVVRRILRALAAEQPEHATVSTSTTSGELERRVYRVALERIINEADCDAVEIAHRAITPYTRWKAIDENAPPQDARMPAGLPQ